MIPEFFLTHLLSTPFHAGGRLTNRHRVSHRYLPGSIYCRRALSGQYRCLCHDTQGDGRNHCPPPGGMIFQRAISTFLGSFIPSTRPIRLTRRIQWVSVTMAGFPKTSPMIRLALLRPTPGSFKRRSKSSGLFPHTHLLKSAYTCEYPWPCSFQGRMA